MKIVVLLMVICSTTPGNECKTIDSKEFKDMYECTLYGYSYSEKIMLELGPDFVNNYGAYTKFSCQKKEII